MSATYKSIELVGTSAESYAEATRSAIRRASKSMRGLKWFEVHEMRGRIEDDDVDLFHVKLTAWFELED